MKKSYIIIGIVVILMLAVAGIYARINKTTVKNENTTNVENNVNSQNPENSEKNNESGENDMYKTGTHHAEMVVKDYGTVKMELYADIAPITVANFAKLVNEGFYNGLTFHRIMSGFMIQGGDPLGNGTGGSDEEIKGEFALNGVENSISHTRGTISMARASAYNSASSQFFIMHQDYTGLDGAYAAFGKVTDGMEVVDKICENVIPVDNNGTVLKNEQPVIESIKMID
jgi:peptidyl-prolyl cis-trans isomerase B (cyclophilin B)